MNKIDYVHFVNEKLLTPFAPSWNYFIAEKLLSNIDCNRLKDYLLSRQQEILSIKDRLSDGGTGLGLNNTTSRYKSYNIFSWDQPDINILKQEIVSMCENYHMRVIGKKISGVGLGGWVNIMKRGERIENHNHGFMSDSYLSGNFIVSCNNTKTVYNNPFQQYIKENKLLRMVEEEDGDDCTYPFYSSKNTEGKLTLFPSYIPHFTTEHKSHSYRITIGFELKPFLN